MEPWGRRLEVAGENIHLGQFDAEFLLKLIEKLPWAAPHFNLYEIEGYSHEEIAQIMGINVNSCRVYLSRAKKKLRKYHRTIRGRINSIYMSDLQNKLDRHQPPDFDRAALWNKIERPRRRRRVFFIWWVSELLPWRLSLPLNVHWLSDKRVSTSFPIPQEKVWSNTYRDWEASGNGAKGRSGYNGALKHQQFRG